ncbi:hypothetical protein EDB87DRAFT_1573273 [Lactarius vividus]|nr:hypothetical protein EDB87DRAFT_1573273 [Lactarius vividus]
MDPEAVLGIPRCHMLRTGIRHAVFLLMAPPIVSWSDNEICISPVLSSAASIVSFDSTFSDTYLSRISPNALEAPGLPRAKFGAEYTGLPGFSEGTIPRGGQATPDESFIQHDAYFFEDGNVTFLVDGTMYCVHRYFFSRDSVYFSARFTQLGVCDHEALSTIISIGDVERKDFEALLSILYPANFEAHELTYEQWKSVLHLSTRWGFASLRKLAIKSIEPPTPHDQFVLARTYSVDHWVLPALTALCERSFPLSLDEARQMNMEDVVLVATVREEIRGGALRVDAADIRRHIEVALAEKLSRPMGNEVDLDRPKSGQESDSTKSSAVNPSVEAEDAMGVEETVASPPGPRQRATKEGDTAESDVGRPSKVPVESPGVEQPHVEDISKDCGGSGSATGNNNRSNGGWFGTDPVGKSINASTMGLLGDSLNADPTSRHSPAESGESRLPPLTAKTLPVETQGPQEEAYAKGHLMVGTDVPHSATAGPVTVGNSPEGGDGGGEVDEKVAGDDWDIPVKEGGPPAWQIRGMRKFELEFASPEAVTQAEPTIRKAAASRVNPADSKAPVAVSAPGYSVTTPPTAAEAPGPPNAEFGDKRFDLPGFSERKIPGGDHATPDDSFIRHDAYFFKDGNVTFLLDIRDHEALPTIISIGDIERKDLEAILSILYPTTRTDVWKSVLHLSTRWDFAFLRKLALKSIKPPTSHDKLVLAHTYSVDHWVLPALTALCERSFPLSLDEARQMSIEDVVLVATVREEIRGGALRVEVAQARKPKRLVGNDVYLDRPRSGNKLDSTKSSAVNPSVEAEDGMTLGVSVALPPGPRQKATKEGDTDGSDVGRPGLTTGNNSRSNSGRFAMGKSVIALSADLLGDGSNASPTSGHTPAESGESRLPPLMSKALPPETQGPEEEAHTSEYLPLGVNAATAGPTTADNLPGGAEGGEGPEKVADDGWGQSWAILSASGKKKKKRK